jgi:hypothetical protein
MMSVSKLSTLLHVAYHCAVISLAATKALQDLLGNRLHTLHNLPGARPCGEMNLVFGCLCVTG